MTNLKELIRQIEAQTSYKVSYQGNLADNITIKADPSKHNVEELLADALRGTGISYVIRYNTIILTQEQPRAEAAQQASQTRHIAGRVIDAETKEPIIGATVWVKDSALGTNTNVDGAFDYTFTGHYGYIAVSYIGYQTQEFPVTNLPKVIELSAGNELDEVVVVGYGKQTKQSVTGAISQVKGDELMKAGGVTNVSSALTGLVPGLVTLNYSGKPGQDDAEIFIRTVSTWNDASPLVLIDGIERGMNDIDLGEVENISVLKDASATAVFGVRGGNGVILITTKRGKEGSPTFSASANVTLKMSSKLPKNADSYTGLWYRNQAIENQVSMNGDLWSEYTPTEILRRYRDGDNPYLYPNVDWQSEMLRKHSWSQRYALDVRGGTKFVKYYGSLAYVYDGDVLKGQDFGQGYVPKNDYKRFNFRTNLDFQPTATTTISVDIDGAWGIERTTTATPAYLWPGIYSKGPDQYPVRYEDGTFANNESGYAMYNPVEYFNFSGLERHTRMDINTSFTLNQKLDFVTKGLSFRAMANFQNYYWSIGPNITASRPITKYIDWKTGEETINYPSDYTNSKYGFDYVLGKYTLSTENIWSSGGSPKMSKNLMYQAQFNYNRTFGLHKVSGLILFKRIENAAGSAFPSYREEWAGRATYDFDNRYLFEFNAAYNGSEKFAKGNKFGFFPSAAVKWNLANENFLKDCDWIDDLSIRVSAGLTGNDAISTYRSLAVLSSTTGGYLFDGSQPVAFYRSRLDSPDLTWEKTAAYNVAIDWSMFKGRLNITAEAYKSKTTDLLMSLAVAAQTGYTSRWTNIGSTSNKGIELSIESQNIVRPNFHWTTTLTMSHNDQMVDDIGSEDFISAYDSPGNNSYMMYGYVKGYPLNSLWGFKYGGTWKNADERKENEITKTYVSVSNTDGGARYYDVNHDGVMSREDLIYQGNADPYLYGGLQNTFYIHGFKLGVYFAYSLGGKIYNYSEIYMAGSQFANQYRYMLDAWHPVRNPNSDIPRAGAKSDAALPSDFMIHDASYLRLKNVTLAYTFDLRKKCSWLRDLTLSVSGENLYLWKKYNGFDPDVSSEGTSSTLRRMDLGAYPKPRTIIFSIQLRY